MLKLTSKEAIRAFKGGEPHSLWNISTLASGGRYTLFDRGNGADRVFKDTPAPVLKPKFTLPRGASIFTSGSCFAREIETALVRSGAAKVLRQSLDSSIADVVLNRYTTHAIIGDFRFAFERRYDPANVFPHGDKWIDFTGHGQAESREAMLEQRRAVIDYHRLAVEADAVFITLGLVETWFDRQTGDYTNIPPWGQFLGDRFEMRVTDYAENLQAMKALVSLLRKHCRPHLKIVVTVSPVPMNSTFSGEDVVVANTYSKAVLRAVAQDIARGDPAIDYFPSYEMATLADPKAVWEPDYRHVKVEYVAKIMQAFEAAYIRV